MPSDTVKPSVSPAGIPRRRLRHWLPKSVRQHWKLAATFVAFVAVMATVFGSVRITPVITGDASVITSAITENIEGRADLFDAEVGHDLNILINPAEYQGMIETYQREGEKAWIKAQVEIDGTLITDVAVRLKGNSTLISLRGDSRMPGMAPKMGGQPVDTNAAQPNPAQPSGDSTTAPPGGNSGTTSPTAGELRSRLTIMPQLDPDDPASLPLLLSFNEFAEGRAYQGMTELAVRPGSPVLNEAVSLELTAESGQPSQRHAYVEYSVNDEPTQTRLVLEHPDESYAEAMTDSDGVLYKIRAKANFAYQGGDQTAYTEQFTQVNGLGGLDLQPIISFLKWLDSADEHAFAAELGDWVDLNSLAEYIATQNLLANFDDIGGPGHNGYLYYAIGTGKFSMVSWDLNFALISDVTAGPHDPVTISIPKRLAPQSESGSAGPGGMRIGNALKDRFLASPAFTGLYEDTYRRLYNEIFASGRAVEITERIAASIPTSDSLSQEQIDSAAQQLVGRLIRRSEQLATNEVIARP
ncbi:CotH kinase family protein [Nocardia sp. NPDC055002]